MIYVQQSPKFVDFFYHFQLYKAKLKIEKAEQDEATAVTQI